ncbi:MAG: hypothetical protein NTW32_11945 [Chloroflexi bacterium]|nr:hypothetical protein [Chloroflexota bacterium]
MNKNIKVWVCVLIIVLFSTGCSTGDVSGQGQVDTTRPQPQVRVETLPSKTPEAVLEVTNTSEPDLTATPAALYYDPTPDVDLLANQIESMIDEIDRKLKGENFSLK